MNDKNGFDVQKGSTDAILSVGILFFPRSKMADAL